MVGQTPETEVLIRHELTTQQLDKVFKSNKWTRKLYNGIFPVDLLPRFRPSKTPCFIIVNLDPSHKPGSHWILIFFPHKTSENRGQTFLFDSLGANAEGQNLLSSFFKTTYRFNRLQLQHQASKSCGYFVLAIGLLLSRGVAPENLSSYFARTQIENNDAALKKMVEREFSFT